MPESKHALLSASSSHRWLNCNPSARLELEFADSESEAALEGTAAHALCEHKLRKTLKMRSKKPLSRFDCDEMDACTDGYVEFVMEAIEEAKRDCGDPLVLIEQKLDFSCYVPDGFGTGDCLIVADKRLHVIDFKYGQGVLVDAVENPQMMLYALGALRLFDSLYDIEHVSMTIYQPRRENISTWTIPISDLREWTENTLVPKAALAFKGEGDYIPGSWCTFCRAAVKCRARAEAKLTLAQYEFALPPLLTDAEIEDILAKVDDLVAWASDIKEYALQQAICGKEWNGLKLVEGRSNRKYIDDAIVAGVVENVGFDPYERKVLGVTAMQKLLGKTRFDELLSAYIEKPQGKPTLVPESDKRPAMSTAAADFKENLGGQSDV
jgi:hypothetical protein